ncbi:MAG: MSMEG_0565 family glycosyltransferase [Mycobacteriales bacterium]
MKLALLTYSTRPRGGVVHTLALAEALVTRGHDVDVWTLSRGGDDRFFRPVDPRVRVHVVALEEVPGESVGERVTRSVAAMSSAFCGDYDIVHAQDCITANAVPRCIRTIHHLDAFTTPQLVACHETAIRRPRAHICVSAAVAAEVHEQYGIRATVIPNGVDAARFAAARPGDRRWAHLGRFVLAVGGIEPRKGSLDLIEAMALLRRGRPDVELVVAGGETLFDYRPYREAFDARALQLAVQPIILGAVPDDDLPSLVASAAVFAFPSTKEGFGLAAMEALAARRPLIVRDLPVLREVFDGAAVFASDVPSLAEALRQALDAPDEQRAGRGEALARRHTWDLVAQAHEQFYAMLTP